MNELEYGDVTRIKINGIIESQEKMRAMQLQLVAVLDMKIIVATSDEVEGD